jgi:hypothetical protein
VKRPAVAVAIAFVILFIVLAAMRADWFSDAPLPQELSDAR